MERRITRQVEVGNLTLGSANRISVQTMWDSPMPTPEDHKSFGDLLDKLRLYRAMGCDIVRFSYPDLQDHQVFAQICAQSPMPVVADIHFDWKLAMDAIACGVHKIRINPGNIGARWKVDEVVRCAKDHGAAIRIGLNSGSLPLELREQDHVKGMVATALTYIEWFEALDFQKIVVSLKDTDTETTYLANKALAPLTPYPLHLGVTEAGGVITSVTRSTWVLGRLLAEGIGDTLRISITDDREHEIAAAREILRTVGVDASGIRVVSCPRCGRATFDTQSFLKKVNNRLLGCKASLTVAIMGCQVNGPGEAAHADLAITGIGEKVYLYEKGRLVREIHADIAEQALFEHLEALANA